jgi:hypothetical protein
MPHLRFITLAGVFFFTSSVFAEPQDSTTAAASTQRTKVLDVGTKAPKLEATGTKWLNTSKPVEFADDPRKVTLVIFSTVW